MAFGINYVGRINTSANNEVQRAWVYNGTDTGSNETIATITASGYFNPFQVNLALGLGPLTVNDLILIYGNDAAAFYTVTAVTPNVTVSAFAAAGTIGTSNIDNGAVTTPKLAADAVDNSKLADDAVSLENLDDGIAPSHVVKFAAQATTTGGAAAEAITVTGALATDLAFVQLVDDGTNNVSVLSAAVTADTLTVTFSADPGADAVINYQLLRAAV